MTDKILPLLGRRSVRAYLPDAAVSEAELRALLEAAMAAPSAMARDPWRFLVLRERADLAALESDVEHAKNARISADGESVCPRGTRETLRPMTEGEFPTTFVVGTAPGRRHGPG